MTTRRDNTRVIKSPTGTTISCKSWLTEAPMRMLMNNLDPGVAERPEELVVYGGIGRAARNWEAYDKIVAGLRSLEEDETLLVQSGKPVGIFRTQGAILTKAALDMLGLPGGPLRLPLVAATDAERDQLRRDLIEGGVQGLTS